MSYMGDFRQEAAAHGCVACRSGAQGTIRQVLPACGVLAQAWRAYARLQAVGTGRL